MEINQYSVLPAPLAGITNEPFRLSLREVSVDTTFTEMVSCEGIIRNQPNTINMLKLKKEKGKVILQLFGAEPEVIFKAAEISVTYGYKFIDINMGCPVKKVIKKGAGVMLMTEPLKVKEIFSKLRRLPVFLSAKIRLGAFKDNLNYLEIINILFNEGVDAVTLHPRVGEEFFKKTAQWEYIRVAKDKFPDFFIIGNGDIQHYRDIEKMFSFTNCDAVMIGRKICENPYIIEQWKSYLENKRVMEYEFYHRMLFFKTLFEYLKEFYDEKKVLNLSKKYLIFLTKGLPNSVRFRKKISEIKKCIEILNEISYWKENYKIKDK